MPKTHLLTLSFDDGFKKSFTLAARIHEDFGLRACLNIYTQSCHPQAVLPDKWHEAPLGGWELWNELAARGHELMPHGYDHCNHARVPLKESLEKIDLCLEGFEQHLHGFKPDEAVFNFPYNASVPPVEEYVLKKFRALRTAGSGFNPWPSKTLRRLTTTGSGPENCEEHLSRHVDQLLESDGGWLLYNTHGFDEEGWGPISPAFLRQLYERLLKIPTVEIMPAAAALKKYGTG